MAVISLVYGCFVYLVFFRFKLLPWNKLSQSLVLVFGVVFLCAFFVMYKNFTPVSSQAVRRKLRGKAAISL